MKFKRQDIISNIFLYAIALYLMLYAAQWTFNHIDPWIGISVYVITAFLVIKIIYNKIKKHI